MQLLTRTQELLDQATAAGISLQEIAAVAGGDVNHEWLKKFAKKKISHPSVVRIQLLHDGLRNLKPFKHRANA